MTSHGLRAPLPTCPSPAPQPARQGWCMCRAVGAAGTLRHCVTPHDAGPVSATSAEDGHAEALEVLVASINDEARPDPGRPPDSEVTAHRCAGAALADSGFGDAARRDRGHRSGHDHPDHRTAGAPAPPCCSGCSARTRRSGASPARRRSCRWRAGETAERSERSRRWRARCSPSEPSRTWHPIFRRIHPVGHDQAEEGRPAARPELHEPDGRGPL